MFKLPNWLCVLLEIVGGWWSLMSGAASIPFAFLALFLPQEYGKVIFAGLAFCSLWILIIRMGWKNFQLMEEIEMQILTTPRPLEIKALPAHRIHQHWFNVEVEIRNVNKTINGARVRLIKIEPPLGTIGGLGEINNIDGIEFDLIGASDGVLHKNQTCRVYLLGVSLHGGLSIQFPHKKVEFQFYYHPKYGYDNKPVDHILTVSASATGIDANIKKFKLKFQTENQRVPFLLEEV